MRWLLVLVAACKAAPSPPIIANHARPEPVSCRLTGMVVDARTGEHLAGATLLLTSNDIDHEEVQITDEDGRFAYGPEARGLDRLTIYYDDMQARRRVDRCGELNLAVRLQPMR